MTRETDTRTEISEADLRAPGILRKQGHGLAKPAD